MNEELKNYLLAEKARLQRMITSHEQIDNMTKWQSFIAIKGYISVIDMLLNSEELEYYRMYGVLLGIERIGGYMERRKANEQINEVRTGL